MLLYRFAFVRSAVRAAAVAAVLAPAIGQAAPNFPSALGEAKIGAWQGAQLDLLEITRNGGDSASYYLLTDAEFNLGDPGMTRQSAIKALAAQPALPADERAALIAALDWAQGEIAAQAYRGGPLTVGEDAALDPPPPLPGPAGAGVGVGPGVGPGAGMAGPSMPAGPVGPPPPRRSIRTECMAKLEALTAERPTFGLPRVDYVARYAAKCPVDPSPPTPGKPPTSLATPQVASAGEGPARPRPPIHFPWPA